MVLSVVPDFARVWLTGSPCVSLDTPGTREPPPPLVPLVPTGSLVVPASKEPAHLLRLGHFLINLKLVEFLVIPKGSEGGFRRWFPVVPS